MIHRDVHIHLVLQFCCISLLLDQLDPLEQAEQCKGEHFCPFFPPGSKYSAVIEAETELFQPFSP